MDKLKQGILAVGFAWLAPIASVSAYTISDIPLFLDNSVVPNVLLNMSVETPMGGAAYADQAGNPAGCGTGTYATPRPSVGGDLVGICYIPTQKYLGYFDPDKCYTYSSNQFNPSGATGSNHTCSSKWSGNFLNWATMTAIDMFTWTMTGGNRVTDTTTETVIRRARKQNNDAWFPHKLLNATYNVAPSSVTPYSDSSIYIENTAYGVKIGTTRGGNDKGTFDVKVKVCDSTQGVEANCKAYGSNYKPEGLVQKNADKMRFALTSYLNDNSQSRDGGVLRSKMKHVGPTYATSTGAVNNLLKEFDPTTGQLINNPDGASGYNSGVINYINKFSDVGYKSYDPIGELYYESLRYFKHLGPTPEYHNNWNSGSNAGGFTVYTTWDDPIQYSCQKSFMVGINDANPWLDKRLPGTHFTCDKAGTPGLPAAFTAGDCGPPSNADGDINATALTNAVGALEGLNGAAWTDTGSWTSGPASGQNDSIGFVPGVTTNVGSCTGSKTITSLGEVMGTCSAPQKHNSYYIAGLAHYANTQDIRSDLTGKQTVSTFIIDTQEYQANPLDGPKNMLWLAGKYGGFKDTNNDGNPNVSLTTATAEWDADADGIPDNYVLASDPQKLVDALTRSFNDIFERTSSAAAVASNSTRVVTTAHLYQALFNSADWSGQLKAFPLDAAGNIGSMVWDASQHIPAHGSRIIKTWDGTAGTDFSGTAIATAVGGASSLAYLRGDDSNEEKNGGSFRDRSSRLGDIVNADPHYVKDENFGYNVLPDVLTRTEGTDYAIFLATKPSRTAMVYAAANDGMLHAFRASDGVELFAYVPKAVIPNLHLLTVPAYSSPNPTGHKYFVDGSPTAWDAYWGATPSWKTVLVGSLGAGGKAVYALDVTDPGAFGDTKVLWEFTGTPVTPATPATDSGSQANMGHILGSVTVARFPDGNYWAVFGNGYKSTNGKAVLFMVRMDDHTIVKAFDVGGAPDNGLSTPVLVDKDGDRIVDLVYAGDLKGNLWKFQFPANTSQWGSAYTSGSNPRPLFQAKDSSGTYAQPITAPVEVGLAPAGATGLMVYFGTGQYFAAGDNTNISTQSMYGIVDRDTSTSEFSGTNDRALLQPQTILYEQSHLDDPSLPESDTNPRIYERVISGIGPNYPTEKGWVLDLISPVAGAEGERMVSAPYLFDGTLIYQTITPVNTPCKYGGRSMLMQVNPATGGSLGVPSFDVNGDGLFDSNDMVDIGGGVMSHVSGVDTGVGISGGFGKPIKAGDRAYIPLSGSSGKLGAPPISSGTLKSRASWRQIQ